MSEERLKILKMLKEGRITLEEADVLIDALGEGDPSAGTRGSETDEGDTRTWAHREQTRHHGRAEHQEHGGAGRRGPWDWLGGWSPEKLFDFDWKLDPHQFQTGLRDAMKGFEESLRSAVSGFQRGDFPAGMKELFGRATGTATIDEPIAATGAARLVLKNRWGDVRIVGSDAQEITVHAAVTAWSNDEQSAAQAAQAVRLRHYREGEAIVLGSEVQEGRRARHRIDLDITVPRTFAADLKAMSGDISASGVNGEMRAANFSGDIIVQDCTGSVSVESKSGDIDLLRCGGELRAHTLSGDINLENVTTHAATAHSVSGDVRADIALEERAVIELKSVSGDLAIFVPHDTACAVNLATASGRIENDLPVTASENSDRRLKGTLNTSAAEPGAALSASTQSGNVHLRGSSRG
jgi:Toastrack DUF4097/SHOCT-like domain